MKEDTRSVTAVASPKHQWCVSPAGVRVNGTCPHAVLLHGGPLFTVLGFTTSLKLPRRPIAVFSFFSMRITFRQHPGAGRERSGRSRVRIQGKHCSVKCSQKMPESKRKLALVYQLLARRSDNDSAWRCLLVNSDACYVDLQVAMNILNSGRFSFGPSAAGPLKTVLGEDFRLLSELLRLTLIYFINY